jgi:hypothetical protein
MLIRDLRAEETLRPAPPGYGAQSNHNTVWREIEPVRRSEARKRTVCTTCEGRGCKGRCRFEPTN